MQERIYNREGCFEAREGPPFRRRRTVQMWTLECEVHSQLGGDEAPEEGPLQELDCYQIKLPREDLIFELWIRFLPCMGNLPKIQKAKIQKCLVRSPAWWVCRPNQRSQIKSSAMSPKICNALSRACSLLQTYIATICDGINTRKKLPFKETTAKKIQKYSPTLHSHI